MGGSVNASTEVSIENWERYYICIDLKTFYASVECVDRGLDPLTTPLVVADETRGRTTICLAVTQAMKDMGIRNRCRLFEIPDHIQYIKAMPRMQHYMEVSAQIYGIYLEYVSAQDVHVYSIDECFIDVTPYLKLYHMGVKDFANMLRNEVMRRTGITATVGIGPNLFLAKVALDITAKHVPSRIGILNEDAFKEQIWTHRPITDIWGIGPGIAARLERHGVYDLMGVAALDENILYDELGVNAEYLIDHAFGREPCTIADIHAYRPQATSTTCGQVLSKGYAYEQAYTVLREMVDTAVLDLVDKQVVCDSISLFVGYASQNAELRRLNASGTAQYVDGCGNLRSSSSDTEPASTAGPAIAPRAPQATARSEGRRRTVREAQAIDGIFVGEHGGKPRGGYAALFAHSNASRKLPERTNSFKKLMGYFDELWVETVDPKRPVKRINLGFGNLLPEEFATVDLFSDAAADEREHDLARTVLAVKGKFGKNALLKGLSFTEGATQRERNDQVGGHRA